VGGVASVLTHKDLLYEPSVDDPSASTSDPPRDEEEAHRSDSTEHLVVILKLSKTHRPSTRSKSLCPGGRHCAVFEVSHRAQNVLPVVSHPKQDEPKSYPNPDQNRSRESNTVRRVIAHP
jgi:hypothetical protein